MTARLSALKHERDPLGLLLSLLIGIAAFSVAFDLSVLDPTNIDWVMSGDVGQHFTGWHAFRYDDWRFPLTQTNLLGSPHGVPIVFTDSNPLLAIPFKLFSPLLPERFQYIGMWYLLCLCLQALFAYRLVYHLSGHRWFSLMASGLFVLYPPLLARTGHDTLMAHWLLLWAIDLAIFPRTLGPVFRQSILILVLSVTVHLYLTAMALPLVMIAVLMADDRRLPDRPLAKLAAIGALGIIIISEMTILGYFGLKGSETSGFGHYSMNLNALFNSGGMSNFLPRLPHGPGQYEGFQYLGLGGLFLLGLAALALLIPAYFRRPARFSVSTRALLLIVYGAAVTLFAVSTTIRLGDKVLVTFGLPETLEVLASTFRSSGRFFGQWPTSSFSLRSWRFGPVRVGSPYQSWGHYCSCRPSTYGR